MQSRHLAARGNFVQNRVFLDTARVASFELGFYVRTALLVSKLGKTGRDEQKSFPLTDYENMTVDDAVNFALYLQQCLNGKRHLAYLPAAGFHAHSKDVVEQATEISMRFGGRLLAKLKHEMKPSVFGRSTGSPFFLAIDADPEASLQHALDVDIANAEKIGHALERLAIVESTEEHEKLVNNASLAKHGARPVRASAKFLKALLASPILHSKFVQVKQGSGDFSGMDAKTWDKMVAAIASIIAPFKEYATEAFASRPPKSGIPVPKVRYSTQLHPLHAHPEQENDTKAARPPTANSMMT